MLPDPVVERRLGAATARLHVELVSLYQRGAGPGVLAIIRELLCGAFHDYRTEATDAKRDLLFALAQLDVGSVFDLIWRRDKIRNAILAGAFNEDEGEALRWVERVAPHVRTAAPIATPPVERPTLAAGQRAEAVHAFLVAYWNAHGRAPTMDELAAGAAVRRDHVTSVLRSLARAGAVTSLGGTRGWTPIAMWSAA